MSTTDPFSPDYSGQQDPYAPDPSVPWDQIANSYVGVPDDYRIYNGIQSYPGNTAGRFAGPTMLEDARGPSYSKPIYQNWMLASLAGSGRQNIAAWQMRLYNMGYLNGPVRAGVYDQATHDALETAMSDANVNGYTLDQMEHLAQKSNKTASQLGWGSSSSGASYAPYTTTSTTENVALTGRDGAKAFLIQAMTAEMGREPTPKEVSRFLHSLNAKEQDHPSTTKSTTTTDPSPGGSSTSTTKSTTKESNVRGDVQAQNFARKIGGKEAQRYQAANYFSVIENLLGV